MSVKIEQGKWRGCVLTALLLFPLIIAAFSPSSAGELSKKPENPAFKVELKKDTAWLVRPDGKPFFSSGVCCIGPGEPWLKYNPKNPDYAAWKYYPSTTDWADSTLSRLKSWGFTTVGGWSDLPSLKSSKQMNMPFTVVIHIGASSGAPWKDMWSPKVLADMEGAVKLRVLEVRDDPNLLGYFSDNELGWWNSEMFHMTLQQPASSGQRQFLIKQLRQDYGNSWTKLNKDFEPVHANSFKDFDKKGDLFLRPGTSGIKEVRKYLGNIATKYYTLCRDMIHKYDKRALLLGDRYQSFYYPEVAKAAAPFVDILSTNLNPSWLDGGISQFYLQTLHDLSKRPLMIGEFYMTAVENSTGNRNKSAGFPLVQTQKERAAGFKGCTEKLASIPYVVGADWFQFSDEPPMGRGDGEDYNMGLVDIYDQPYLDLIRTSSKIDRNAIHEKAVLPVVPPVQPIPHAPDNPMLNILPRDLLSKWNRSQALIPASAPAPIGDLMLTWSDDSLYVGIYAMDFPQTTLYKDKKIPEQDRMKFTLNISGMSKPLEVRFGADRKPASSIPGVEFAESPGGSGGIYEITVMRIPAKLLHKDSLQASDKMTISAQILSHARAYKTSWKKTFLLANSP